MTGFGGAEVTEGLWGYAVEVRSCNHRHCDVRVHAPAEWISLISEVEAAIRARLERGRVDVSIQVSAQAGGPREAAVDLSRALAVRDAARQLAAVLEMNDEVSLEQVLAFPGVLRVVDTPSAEGARSAVLTALDRALERMLEMRRREGAGLLLDLTKRLETIRALVGQLRTDLASSVVDRQARLQRRLQELLRGHEVLEPGRVAQELAVLADRADVSEELHRLEVHCEQFEALMRREEATGRRLDFLLQEMGREANTTGAKVGDANAAHRVVELKAELERIREQVQNVE